MLAGYLANLQAAGWWAGRSGRIFELQMQERKFSGQVSSTLDVRRGRRIRIGPYIRIGALNAHMYLSQEDLRNPIGIADIVLDA